MLSYKTSFNADILTQRAGTVITEASNCTELLRDHTCFHRSITGSEAEERLRTSGYNHCYLTRFSKQHKCYMLTVYQFQIPKHVVEHYKISLNSGKCCLDGKDDLFNDIDELLHHCETHPISPSFVHVGRKYTQEEYRNRRVREQEELRARENEENRAREEVDHGEGCQGQPAKRCSMM